MVPHVAAVSRLHLLQTSQVHFCIHSHKYLSLDTDIINPAILLIILNISHHIAQLFVYTPHRIYQ